MSYAQGTTVPVERSRAEVEKILTKAGADQFSIGWVTGKAVIMFRMKERYIKIEMPLPVLEPKTHSWQQKKGLWYSEILVAKESRRRWRAMILYVKSKIESFESGIVTFEEAFMTHIVLPNRQTAGQYLIPQIESAYKSGKMPPLLGYDG